MYYNCTSALGLTYKVPAGSVILRVDVISPGVDGIDSGAVSLLSCITIEYHHSVSWVTHIAE